MPRMTSCAERVRLPAATSTQAAYTWRRGSEMMDIDRLELEADAMLRAGTLEIGECCQCGFTRNCEVIAFQNSEGEWLETADGELAALICHECAENVFGWMGED